MREVCFSNGAERKRPAWQEVKQMEHPSTEEEGEKRNQIFTACHDWASAPCAIKSEEQLRHRSSPMPVCTFGVDVS